jgi:hypothetical protein
MAEVRPVVDGLLSPELLEECRSLLYIRFNNDVGSMPTSVNRITTGKSASRRESHGQRSVAGRRRNRRFTGLMLRGQLMRSLTNVC